MTRRKLLLERCVREFADYIDCDPELAQKLYFQNDVPSTLDNEQKASMGRELSTLQIVSNNLDKAAKACKGLPLYDDQLRNALRIQGLDLQKQIEDLNRTLKRDDRNMETQMQSFYASIAWHADARAHQICSLPRTRRSSRLVVHHLICQRSFRLSGTAQRYWLNAL